jgi:hypothetical protein
MTHGKANTGNEDNIRKQERNWVNSSLLESKSIDAAQLSLFKKYERMILDSWKSTAPHSASKISSDIWDSASISELVPENVTVCDVGSGRKQTRLTTQSLQID